MKPADWEVLAAYIRSRADELGLRDWFLLLKRDPPPDETALASVNAIEGRRFATIRVCTEFRELTADEQRNSVIHELLHCHLAEGHHYLAGVLRKSLGAGAEAILDALRLKIEYAVDGITSGLAEHMEHIAWETPDPTREESASAPYEGPIDTESSA